MAAEAGKSREALRNIAAVAGTFPVPHRRSTKILRRAEQLSHQLAEGELGHGFGGEFRCRKSHADTFDDFS